MFLFRLCEQHKTTAMSISTFSLSICKPFTWELLVVLKLSLILVYNFPVPIKNHYSEKNIILSLKPTSQ